MANTGPKNKSPLAKWSRDATSEFPSRYSWLKYGSALIVFAGSLLAYWQYSKADSVSVVPIKATASSLNFGTQWVNHKFPWNLRLANPGSEVVHISRIETKCGCTTPLSSTLSIPAGGEADIPLLIDLSTDDLKEEWTFSTDIQVHVAGEAKPREWTVSGQVRRALMFSQPFIDFGDQLIANRNPQAAVLEIEAMVPVETIMCELDPTYGRAEVTPKGENKFELRITPSNQLSLGPHGFSIQLTAVIIENHTELPAVTVNCSGRSVSDLDVLPSRMSCGTVIVGETIIEVVSLRSRSGEPLGDIEIEPSPGTKVVAHNDRPNTYVVEFVAEAGMSHATVHFTASGTVEDHGAEAEFVVDYFGINAETNQISHD